MALSGVSAKIPPGPPNFVLGRMYLFPQRNFVEILDSPLPIALSGYSEAVLSVRMAYFWC
jgi:hypothetical protein